MKEAFYSKDNTIYIFRVPVSHNELSCILFQSLASSPELAIVPLGAIEIQLIRNLIAHIISIFP